MPDKCLKHVTEKDKMNLVVFYIIVFDLSPLDPRFKSHTDLR